jgi:peptidylprolyl isomerase
VHYISRGAALRIAREGDKVKVHYLGKLDDETIFDSTEGSDPLEFTIGEGSVVRGFDEAMVGMAPGQSKVAVVPPEKAYGPHMDSKVLKVALDKLPSSLEPEVGDILEITLASGRPLHVVVMDISHSKATLDANHPLAGRELIFEIELIEIF